MQLHGTTETLGTYFFFLKAPGRVDVPLNV